MGFNRGICTLGMALALAACGGGGGGASPPVATGGTAQGLWQGTTNTGYNVALAVLDDSTTWGFYYYAQTIYGAFNGQASGNGSAFSGTGSFYNFASQSATTDSFNGTVTPHTTLSATDTRGDVVTATYSSLNSSTPTLASLAGSYTGNATTKTSGNQRTTLALDASGHLSGTNAGCTVSGTVSPRTGVTGVFNLSVGFSGTCLLGSGTTASGIAVVDTTQSPPVVYAMGLNPGKTDGFMFAGSQSNPTGSSGLTFNLQQAFVGAIQSGQSLKLNVSGTCLGTYVTNTTTPTPATFESIVGYSTTTTATRTLSNCTPAVSQDTELVYYNAAYMPTGDVDSGLSLYGKYTPVPTIPTSASVGASGTLSTVQFWTDASKATAAGSVTVSYSLLPDTTTTAIARLTMAFYNPVSVLQYTITKNYRLDNSGALQVIGMSVAYAGGATLYYQ